MPNRQLIPVKEKNMNTKYILATKLVVGDVVVAEDPDFEGEKATVTSVKTGFNSRGVHVVSFVSVTEDGTEYRTAALARINILVMA